MTTQQQSASTPIDGAQPEPLSASTGSTAETTPTVTVPDPGDTMPASTPHPRASDGGPENEMERVNMKCHPFPLKLQSDNISEGQVHIWQTLPSLV